MQAEFTRYIKVHKTNESTGGEIMRRIMSAKLAKNFTTHDGNGWQVRQGRKEAFRFTMTFTIILNVLGRCLDSKGVRCIEI